MEKLEYYSVSQVQREFGLQNYGQGMHKTFKKIVRRALCEGAEVETWFSQYQASQHGNAPPMKKYPTSAEFRKIMEEMNDWNGQY